MFLPVSYSERSSRCFTVFDYNQQKDDANWQNILKSKTQEDKQAWQSAILTCILNGYDKKVSHDVINKLMEKDSDANKSSSELIRKKLSSNCHFVIYLEILLVKFFHFVCFRL